MPLAPAADLPALQVASGSFCRLTEGCRPVSFRQIRIMPSRTLGSAMANQRHPAFSAGMEERERAGWSRRDLMNGRDREQMTLAQ
jgi:hypothetical protein